MAPVKRKSDVGGDGGLDASKKAKLNGDGNIMTFFGPPKTTRSSTTNANAISTSTSTSTSRTTATTKPPSSQIKNALTLPTPIGKTAAAAAIEGATTFDKAKWVQTLTAEQRQTLGLEINTMGPSWLALLKDDIIKPEFLALKKFIEGEVRSGKTVFPPAEDVYSWSRHTPYDKVKAVIIGQDPYHNHNQAHGLCFSVRPPTPAPPSLKNMYKALKKDYPLTFHPPPNNLGLLTPWAERGVLMLNTCLTVRAHSANSHQKRGWEQFTQRVIDLVAAKPEGVVFLAWGNAAGERVRGVDGTRHMVLKSVHPSPLSASRGFFDCGHFRLANEWLRGRYGVGGEIDWNLGEGRGTVGEDEEGEGVEHEGDGDVVPVVAVGEVGVDGKEEREE